jgi:hypothetical protein
MVPNLILHEIEPEAGQLGQHSAFVRDAFVHDHIKCRKPVSGDDQQFIAEFVNVTHFSSRKELDTGKIRFQQNCLSHKCHCVGAGQGHSKATQDVVNGKSCAGVFLGTTNQGVRAT